MSTHPLERPPRETQGRVGRRLAWRFALPLAVVAGMITTGAASAATLQSSKAPTQPGSPAAAVSICPDASSSLFGPNVCVFNPSMSTASIQAQADAIFAQQDFNEMGTERYSLLFKPGVYGTAAQPLNVKVGYYTEVAGPGQDPDNFTINGTGTAAGHNGSGDGALDSHVAWVLTEPGDLGV